MWELCYNPKRDYQQELRNWETAEESKNTIAIIVLLSAILIVGYASKEILRYRSNPRSGYMEYGQSHRRFCNIALTIMFVIFLILMSALGILNAYGN